MNHKLIFKIATDIYTSLISSESEEQKTLNITFKDLKSDILGKKDDVIVNKLKALNAIKNSSEIKSLINEKDNKNYTLLMLTVSNNLPKATKQLLDMKVDTTPTIPIQKQHLKKLIKYYENNEQLSEDELEVLKNLNRYEATALDIAKIKNLKNIINLFK